MSYLPSLAALGDVSLTAPAQGDTFYRGALTWNNLVHGTAGQVLVTNGAGANPSWSSGPLTLTPDLILTRAGAANPADPKYFTITPGADTALTASVEANDVLWSLNRTQQFATGALANQRAVWIRKPTYGFVGASTLTNAATVAIEGAPVAGANATITNDWALWVMGDTSRFDGPITCPGAGASSERFGNGALAAGLHSAAFGNGASAAGQSSLAMGVNASASVQDAFAFGENSIADHTQAMAFGTGSKAQDIASLAIGYIANAKASSQASIVVGYNAQSSGLRSVCLGQGTNSTATEGTAVGSTASVSGLDAMALGAGAVASANFAIALGVLAQCATANAMVVGAHAVPVTAIYWGSGQTDTTPTAASLNGTGGSGTNIAGASLTVAGGQSTGSAAGGPINFATSPAGGAGATLNSLTTWLSLSSAGVFTLTDGVNIPVGSTTGTQWGTVGGAAGQKQGWWGKTPIVQPLLATGAGHTADDIITVLQNLGLCRQT